jgi:FkbM family methyltransferase
VSLPQTIRFVLTHPLNRDRKLQSLWRYLGWQIGSRLVPGPVACDFVEGSRLLVCPGMKGATGNLYAGLHDFEEMALLLHLLRPEDQFVDVGANIGSYTILASAAVGCRCISFEPDANAFAWLQQNISLNDVCDRVETHQQAVGSHLGEIQLTSDLDTTNRVVGPEPQMGKAQSVPLITLDLALEDRQPIAIKIDVEGYETEVLNGAGKVLDSKELCCVLLELNGSGSFYGFDERRMYAQMLDLGFREFQYLPFERALVPLASPGQRNNAILIRDSKRIRDRLKTARHYRVLGSKL